MMCWRSSLRATACYSGTHSEDDVTELIRLKLPKIKTETKTKTKIKTKTETKITFKTKTVDFHVKPIELQ